MEEDKEIKGNDNAIIQVSTNMQSVEATVMRAERYIEAMAKIRLLAIKATTTMDWSAQGDKPYLEKSGCDKIASTFGLKLYSPTFEFERHSDDKGEYGIYTCSGEGEWNNVRDSEIGTCSTRDDFFGKKSGEWKPMSEIDLTDIKKKAFTNWANRIIKKILGLSFTWEELATLSDNKITQATVKKVEFGKGTKGGNIDSPETKNQRDEIRKMLLSLNDGEEASARKMLEEMTTFQGTDRDTGKPTTVKGKNNVSYLTEKQVPMVHGQLKKRVDEFNKNLDKQASLEGKTA